MESMKMEGEVKGKVKGGTDCQKDGGIDSRIVCKFTWCVDE